MAFFGRQEHSPAAQGWSTLLQPRDAAEVPRAAEVEVSMLTRGFHAESRLAPSFSSSSSFFCVVVVVVHYETRFIGAQHFG